MFPTSLNSMRTCKFLRLQDAGADLLPNLLAARPGSSNVKDRCPITTTPPRASGAVRRARNHIAVLGLTMASTTHHQHPPFR